MASENELSIEISADTRAVIDAIKKVESQIDKFGKSASESFKKTTSAFDTFAGTLATAGVVAAIGGITIAATKLFGIFSDGIQDAAEAETAFNSLAVAFAQTGVNGEAAATKFSAFAEELQKTSIFEDDLIVKNAALIQSMTRLSGDALEKATQAAADLASQFNLDLGTASRKVALALDGNSDALKKYGIEIEKGATKTQTMANAFKALEQFAGAAEAKTKTFAGASTQLNNAFGNIGEALGNIIVKNPLVIAAMNTLTVIFTNISNVIKANEATIIAFVNNGLLKLVEGYNKVIQVIQNTINFFQRNIETIQAVGIAVGATIAIYGAYVLAMNASAIATGAVAAVTAVWNALLKANPIGLVIVAVAALTAGIIYLKDNFDLIIGTIQRFVGEALQNLAPAIRGVLEAVSAVAGVFNTSLKESIDAAIKKIDNLGSGLRQAGNEQILMAEKTKQAKEALDQQNAVNLDPLKVNIEGVTQLVNENTSAQQRNLATIQENAVLSAEAERQKFSLINEIRQQQQAVEDEQAAMRQIGDQLKDDEDFQRLSDNLGRREALRVLFDARDLANAGKHAQARQKIRDAVVKSEEQDIFRIQKFEELSNKQRFDNMRATFQVISQLQSNGNKEFFRIGQAAAIATATMDGFVAVQKALASAPFPINVGFAAIIAGMTAANIAKIASTKPPEGKASFQDGGIVPGSSFTGDNVLANVNSGEMILNRSQQASLFNQINNGGSGNNDGVMSAINNLAMAVGNQPIVVKIQNREVARSVRDARLAGFSTGVA